MSRRQASREAVSIPPLRRAFIIGGLLLLPACGGSGADAGAGGGAATQEAAAAAVPVADTLVVYKTPTCGCCNAWIDHMEENGFTVVAHDQGAAELNRLKGELGVSAELTSCHTARIAGYVVEGHVPADLVKRLLQERPQVAGLAVPGMPIGSPGMEGGPKQDYDVIAFRRDGSREVYASR